jgi:hypothetical protein
VKKKFLKLFAKNENGVHNYLELNPYFIDGEVSLSNIELKDLQFEQVFSFKRAVSNQDVNMLKKIISNKIEESYSKLKKEDQEYQMRGNLKKSFKSSENQYLDSQSRTFLQQNESINNIVLNEDFHYMDKGSRMILKEKAQKTFDLITDLKRMRLRQANERASKAVWEEELIGEKKKTIHLVATSKSPMLNLLEPEYKFANIADASPPQPETIKEDAKNDSQTGDKEEHFDFRKPLLAKLKKQITGKRKIYKENSLKLMEFDNKAQPKAKKEKEKKKVSIKNEVTPNQQENVDETNLFKKQQDNGGEGENIKHQINNKLNNINRLLVGVINKGKFVN